MVTDTELKNMTVDQIEELSDKVRRESHRKSNAARKKMEREISHSIRRGVTITRVSGFTKKGICTWIRDEIVVNSRSKNGIDCTVHRSLGKKTMRFRVKNAKVVGIIGLNPFDIMCIYQGDKMLYGRDLFLIKNDAASMKLVWATDER